MKTLPYQLFYLLQIWNIFHRYPFGSYQICHRIPQFQHIHRIFSVFANFSLDYMSKFRIWYTVFLCSSYQNVVTNIINLCREICFNQLVFFSQSNVWRDFLFFKFFLYHSTYLLFCILCAPQSIQNHPCHRYRVAIRLMLCYNKFQVGFSTLILLWHLRLISVHN